MPKQSAVIAYFLIALVVPLCHCWSFPVVAHKCAKEQPAIYEYLVEPLNSGKSATNIRSIIASCSMVAALSMSINLPAQAADDFFLQQRSSDPLKVKAMKELRDLKALQDSRLDACVGA